MFIQESPARGLWLPRRREYEYSAIGGQADRSSCEFQYCPRHLPLKNDNMEDMVGWQHKIRWLAYVLVALLLGRAVFSFADGAIGQGVGLVVAAGVVFILQRLLERDARNMKSRGQDTIF